MSVDTFHRKKMDLHAKLFIFLYIAFNCVMAEFSDEQLELMKNLHNECVSQTGVNEDYIEDCRKGVFPDDPKIKCYLKCLFDELGTIKDDGTIDSEGLLAIMPDDIREKITDGVRKCGTVVGSNICDTIYLTNQCYYKERPNDFFVI